MKQFDFIKVFFSDYKVGALSKTSKLTASQISRMVASAHPNVVVEFGPGEGVITRLLLPLLSADARLIVIETNEKFVEELKKINDTRLIVVQGSATNVASIVNGLGIKTVDCIFSGIPFSFFPVNVRAEIIRLSHTCLVTGGVMILYQYSTLMKNILKKQFGNVSVKINLFNFPLYFVMKSRKN